MSNNSKLQQRIWEVSEQIEQSFQMLHHALYKRQSELQSELDEVVSQNQDDDGDDKLKHDNAENDDEELLCSRLKFFAIKMDSALREIREFGTVAMSDVDPNSTTIPDRSILSNCPVNEDITAEIVLKNCDGQLIQNRGLLEPKVELTVKHENRPVCEIIENDSSPPHLVRIKIRLPDPGEYDLSVKICENIIHGSPFTVLGVAPISEETKDPVIGAASDESIQKIGSRGIKPNDFGHPLSILLSNGRTLITDIGNSCIQVFAQGSGDYVTCFGPKEKKAGKLLRPVDIAETLNGHYLVTDFELKVVLVYELDGQYVSCFGQKVLLGPRGLCVDKYGRIIVADCKDSSLVIFKGTGKFLRKIKGGASVGKGLSDDRLGAPNFVTTATESGDILVTDTQGHCVRVYDKEGEFKKSFGSKGNEWGEFQIPAGICCAPKSGDIIVADTGLNRIMVFNSHYLCTNIIRPCLDPLLRPQGVSVSNDEALILVVDSGNHCFRTFQKNL